MFIVLGSSEGLHSFRSAMSTADYAEENAVDLTSSSKIKMNAHTINGTPKGVPGCSIVPDL